MEVYVDSVDVDSIGGFDKVLAGGYHTCITSVEEGAGKKGEMIVRAEILRGTTANQVGKEHMEQFSVDTKPVALRKLHALAIASDLITKEDLAKHKAAGTSPNYDFASIVGKQVCMDLEANEYTDNNGNLKSMVRLAWDQVYHPLDKRASHIPLHTGMLEKAGIKLPPTRNPDGAVSTTGPGAKPNGNTAKPATTPPAVSPAQAANVDDLLSGM